MTRVVLAVGKEWEERAMFSLGVITHGELLHTAGVTSRSDDGSVVGKDDMRAQVKQCFANLEDILKCAGATWNDIVKYTIYTTDIDRYDTETREIRKPFYVGRPAATLVEVRKLMHPDMLVEVEAIVDISKK
jgi:2-iminobutanoate/2-iminopropanoate deaminase